MKRKSEEKIRIVTGERTIMSFKKVRTWTEQITHKDGAEENVGFIPDTKEKTETG